MASAVAAADVDVVYDKGGMLIKIWRAVASNTSTVVFTHGGPGTPDHVVATNDTNLTGGDITVTARTATTFTVDNEAGSGSFSAMAFWFNAAATTAPSP